MTSLLQVQGLTKTYKTRGNLITAVDDISFAGNSGEVLGFLGPNGSGKTTTVKSIASIILYDQGKICVDGYDNIKNKKKTLERIGAVLEGNRNIYWRMSVWENIRYFAGIRGLSPNKIKHRAEMLMDTLSLKDVADKEVRKLSNGMQKKAAIACSIIHDPMLLLLDEPTLGLDVATVRTMKEWVRQTAVEENRCILITSHDLDFVEQICDRIIIIHEGKIISEASVDDMKYKYSPKKTIHLHIHGTLDRDILSQLQRISQWAYTNENGTVRLTVRTEDLSILYPTFAVLDREGLQLTDMSCIQDTLEDIFIDITRQKKD